LALRSIQPASVAPVAVLLVAETCTVVAWPAVWVMGAATPSSSSVALVSSPFAAAVGNPSPS
jgi:hypothetical protein